MKTTAFTASPAFKFVFRSMLPVLTAAACYIGLQGCNSDSNSSTPSAAFVASSTAISPGQSISFTDQSDGDGDSITSWSWTFTGGTPASSSEQNPTGIVYSSVGAYSVSLEVTTVDGEDTETKGNYINVSIAPLVADFVGSATEIYEGDTVDFTDQSTGNPTSWQWTFEGGNPSSSTDQNPTGIIYANQGFYDVTLVATNADGSNTMVKAEYVIVYESIPYCSPAYDIDGNMYQVVEIGGHCWMAENLKTTSYTNGVSISTGLSGTDWDNNTTGAYKYYNDNSSNNATYGKLYNWHAINNSNGICPDDWHVATDAEWTDLFNALGGSTVANPKMRSAAGWSTNSGNNSSGFTALPGGLFGTDGQYGGLGNQAYFWSATETDATSASSVQLYNDLDEVFHWPLQKNAGISCRCVKD